MKKKIAIISPHMELNGAAVMTLDFIDMLDKELFEIDLYVYKYGELVSRIPDHVNVILPSRTLQIATMKKNEIRNLKDYVSKSLAVLKNKITGQKYHYYKEKWKKDYDVVICHTEDEPIFYAQYNFTAKKKIVWIHIEIEKKYQNNPHFKNGYAAFDQIVCVSKASARSFERTFPELSSKVITIYNRINIDRILDLASKNTENRIMLEKNAIVTVCRLNIQKRVDRCIEVAKILKDLKVNFNWYIVGDGSEEMIQQLDMMIKENQLQDQFILYGKTSNPYFLINQAKVCVLLSDFEGYATFINEARVLKKPIVATNFTAIDEQIENEVSGYYFKKDDLKNIAETIKLLLNDENLSKKIASAIPLDQSHNEMVLHQTLGLLKYD